MPALDAPAAPAPETMSTSSAPTPVTPAAPKSPAPARSAPKPAASKTTVPSPAQIHKSLSNLAEKGPNPKIATPENLAKIGATPEDLKAKPLSTPVDDEQPDVETGGDAPSPTPSTASSPDPSTPETKPGKKPGPWQLKEAYEKKAREWEKRALEAESKVAGLAEADKLKQRAEQAESRLKEVEDHLRYVDYSKSEEFKTKYQQPYEEAYSRAYGVMSKFKVNLPNGESRAFNHQDLIELAGMSPDRADPLIQEMFGPSANRVTNLIEKVQETAWQQQKALDEAKKNGAEFQQQRETKLKGMAAENGQIFTDMVREDAQKYDFLKPKEGDDEWNAALEKAQKFVDSVFTKSAADPHLSAEQRKEIIREHASVRGRAIGYPMLKLQVKRLQSELAKRDKIIAQYNNGEPDGGGEKPVRGTESSTAPTTDSITQSLLKVAAKNRL